MRTRKLLGSATVVDVSNVIVLLDALALTLRGPFCDRSGEEGHELSNGASLVERKRRKIGGIAEDSARTRRRRKNDGEGEDLDHGGCLERLLPSYRLAAWQ